MVNSRASLAAFVMAALLPALPPAARATLPDYRIGDIVREDVFAPEQPSSGPLRSPAAESQPRGQSLDAVVRFNPKSPDESEVSLRAAIIMARYNFLRTFQDQLLGRKPTEADLGSPAYLRTITEISRGTPASFPFDQLAPLWISGQSEETFVLTLAQPIRQAMANIIVDDKTSASLPPDGSLRLITVKNLAMPLGVRDLDGPGLIISRSKTITLSYARQLVEKSLPASQPNLARFAATFVRANTQPDPAATALIKNRPPQATPSRPSAESGQVILRKGQVIDRRALSDLAALREKHPELAPRASALPAQTQPASKPPSTATRPFESSALEFTFPSWTPFAAAGALAVLTGFFWIKGARKKKTRPHRTSLRRRTHDELTVIDNDSETVWRERARLAEAKADRAHEVLRSGALAWMKEKFVSTLFRHRTELLAAQQKAQAEMEQLERRLEQLHAPLQQRIHEYEKRIAELEAKLEDKGEINRHLLGARITLARQQLERSRFESN